MSIGNKRRNPRGGISSQIVCKRPRSSCVAAPACASLHPRVSAQGLKANPSLGLSVFHSCKRYPPAPPMLIIHHSSSRYLATLSAWPCPPQRPLSLQLSVHFLCLYVAGLCADPLLLNKQAQIKTNTHTRTFQLYRVCVCVCLRVLLQFFCLSREAGCVISARYQHENRAEGGEAVWQDNLRTQTECPVSRRVTRPVSVSRPGIPTFLLQDHNAKG